MRRLEWIESFKTGFQEIDAEHREIARLIDDLVIALESGRRLRDLAQATGAIVRAAEQHNETEYAVLARNGYSSSEAHRRRDRESLQRLRGLLERASDFEAVDDRQASDEINDWFIRHMLLTDAEVVTYGARCNKI